MMGANQSQSPRVLSNPQADSHESMIRNEEVVRVDFLNDEEQQQRGTSTKANSSSNGTCRDTSLVSCNGTEHLPEDEFDDIPKEGKNEDELEDNSKERKHEEHIIENRKATANIKPVPSPEKATTVDQPRNHSFDRDGLELVEESATTVEERVLAVLIGRYFNAREEQSHLGEALAAVFLASAGSLTTIQFLAETTCAVDRGFSVVALAFMSKWLTPSVARWLINWTIQHNAERLAWLPEHFSRGNAPLSAGRLLLQHVDLNCLLPSSKGGEEEEMIPVWFHCLFESKDRGNDLRLLLLLREGNPNLSWLSMEGRSALFPAASFGLLGVLEHLANERNMDINHQDGRGCTPLMYAIMAGNTEVAELLASSPLSNLELQSNTGWTALHFAARDNRLDTVTLLVNELHVDVNKQGRFGFTALMDAIVAGNTEVAEFLASSPLSNLELQSEQGCTPLHFAAHHNRLDTVMLLVNELNVDVNQQSRFGVTGVTALMYAICAGNTEIARLLASSPMSNLELQSDAGWTALHFAAHHNRLDTVTLLVNELKVDVNQQCRFGVTALMYTIIAGNTEIARLLASSPMSNLELQSDAGLTARLLAAHLGRLEVIAILDAIQIVPAGETI